MYKLCDQSNIYIFFLGADAIVKTEFYSTHGEQIVNYCSPFFEFVL